MRDRENLVALGQAIKRLRKAKRLSQQALGEQVEVTTNYIGMVERGERAANLLVLFDIAAALDVSPARLFEPFELQR